MRGQDRYGCSNPIMTGPAPKTGASATVFEEWVLAGLKDRLMVPEAAAEAMRAYEEINRINRERRALGAGDRRELAEVEKKIAAMIAVIKDGGYVRGMVDRLRELEARQDEPNEKPAAAPADLPDIHPNFAGLCRRKMAQLAEIMEACKGTRFAEESERAGTSLAIGRQSAGRTLPLRRLEPPRAWRLRPRSSPPLL